MTRKEWELSKALAAHKKLLAEAHVAMALARVAAAVAEDKALGEKFTGDALSTELGDSIPMTPREIGLPLPEPRNVPDIFGETVTPYVNEAIDRQNAQGAVKLRHLPKFPRFEAQQSKE
jgi:hypothetical protein